MILSQQTRVVISVHNELETAESYIYRDRDVCVCVCACHSVEFLVLAEVARFSAALLSLGYGVEGVVAEAIFRPSSTARKQWNSQVTTVAYSLHLLRVCIRRRRA